MSFTAELYYPTTQAPGSNHLESPMVLSAPLLSCTYSFRTYLRLNSIAVSNNLERFALKFVNLMSIYLYMNVRPKIHSNITNRNDTSSYI